MAKKTTKSAKSASKSNKTKANQKSAAKKKTAKKAAKKAAPKNPIARYPVEATVKAKFFFETREGAQAAKSLARDWLQDNLDGMTNKDWNESFKIAAFNAKSTPVDRSK
jgi:hypothetical protein